MQNTIVKEFENNPAVVTLVYDEGSLYGETAGWFRTTWEHLYLRGSAVYEQYGTISQAAYDQPETGPPFGRGFIFDRGILVKPYFGHQPQMVIDTIYELLELFEDGFESGDTAAWSVTVP